MTITPEPMPSPRYSTALQLLAMAEAERDKILSEAAGATRADRHLGYRRRYLRLPWGATDKDEWLKSLADTRPVQGTKGNQRTEEGGDKSYPYILHLQGRGLSPHS